MLSIKKAVVKVVEPKDIKGRFLAPELVNEHTEFTREIKQLIENSAEYKKFADGEVV